MELYCIPLRVPSLSGVKGGFASLFLVGHSFPDTLRRFSSLLPQMATANSFTYSEFFFVAWIFFQTSSRSQTPFPIWIWKSSIYTLFFKISWDAEIQLQLGVLWGHNITVNGFLLIWITKLTLIFYLLTMFSNCLHYGRQQTWTPTSYSKEMQKEK